MEPQVVELILRELKHEVTREPVQILLDRLHQLARCDFVELRQGAIEHHLQTWVEWRRGLGWMRALNWAWKAAATRLVAESGEWPRSRGYACAVASPSFGLLH